MLTVGRSVQPSVFIWASRSQIYSDIGNRTLPSGTEDSLRRRNTPADAKPGTERSVLDPSRISNRTHCRLILCPLKCLAHENRKGSLGITARFLYPTEPFRPHVARRALKELGRFANYGIRQHRAVLCGKVDAVSNCGGRHNLRPAGCR